jgi:hypothetical protein
LALRGAGILRALHALQCGMPLANASAAYQPSRNEELNMIRPSVSSSRKPNAVAAGLSILIAALGIAQAAHAADCYSNWSSAATGSRDAAVNLYHVSDGSTLNQWLQSCTQVDTANVSAGLYVQYSTREGAPSGQQSHFQGIMMMNCQNGTQLFSSWHPDTAPNDNNHPEEIVSCSSGHPTNSYARSWTNYFSTCPTLLTTGYGNGNFWNYQTGPANACPMGRPL